MKLLIPFPPGGPTDVIARLVAKRLGDTLGQPFVVDNRPGATGTIASAAVARSAPDGYTLLVASLSSHISPYMLKSVAYDPAKDFTPVVNMISLPFYFVANPKLDAHSLADLVALAKAKPGMLNFGSPGPGSGGHLCMELFMAATGTRLVHVPYKGAAPAVAALVAGETDVLCDSLSTSHPQVRAGRLRGLALAAPRRFPGVEEIPTTAEAGLPGFELSLWFGLLGPAGLPAPITRKLNEEIGRYLASPEARERLHALGGEFEPNAPGQFAAFLAADTPRWVKIIREVGVHAD